MASLCGTFNSHASKHTLLCMSHCMLCGFQCNTIWCCQMNCVYKVVCRAHSNSHLLTFGSYTSVASHHCSKRISRTSLWCRSSQMIHMLLISLVASILTICCHGRVVEWPATLHHDIHGSRSPHPLHTVGYLELNTTHAARLFYYYAQDRNMEDNSPLVFYTNGGPGGSSMLEAFGSYGPLLVDQTLSLQWNHVGWDKGQNVLFVDQPVGTGFSETTDYRDYTVWEYMVGKDMLTFFLQFMELHPELKEKELYLAGVSYAGHYLPAIAHAIHRSNKEGKHLHLNLKGVLLGNPIIDAFHLYKYSPKYAVKNKLISKETALKLEMKITNCRALARRCNSSLHKDQPKFDVCNAAFDYCDNALLVPIESANPDLNPYNINGTSTGEENFDHAAAAAANNEDDLVKKYLNLPEVQEQLGVNKPWEPINWEVYDHMKGDRMVNMAPFVVGLLNEGIRVMVYSGDRDLVCNWMGNKALLGNMQWNKSMYWKGKLRKWRVNLQKWKLGKSTVTAGACETVEPLTHCRVYREGHSVSPDPAYVIMRIFTTGGVFAESDPTFTSRWPNQWEREKLPVS